MSLAAMVGCCAILPEPARAARLPAHLRPAAPFPRVLACDVIREKIAPGIERADYRLRTAAGPLHVALVVADPSNRSIRFDTVLAHDELGGPLETVTSMAQRTGAVAGINGDYYAAGANNAPLGAVVRNGILVHAGSARPAFAITAHGGALVTPLQPAGARVASIDTAIGGGPILLRNGTSHPDVASTNYADRAMRIPVSVLIRWATGEVGLLAVDGRRPATSIGVNRDELVAMLRALGAADALLLDSGGSTSLVARELGEERAALVNVPSDGTERPVADGFFVYSDASIGPPDALVVHPARITVLPGVTIALRSRLVDKAGHGLGDAAGPWHEAPGSPIAAMHAVAHVDPSGLLHAGSQPGRSTLHVERDGVGADVPVRVVRSIARLAIGPRNVNPSRGQLVELTAQAVDASGEPVTVDNHVQWTARDARIDALGRLTVGDRDAFVTARVGEITTSMRIPVGRHSVPFAVGSVSGDERLTFLTTPPNGRGGIERQPDGVRIRYDFSRGGRAAYARAVQPVVVGELLALACEVDGDGNGAALRLAFTDQYGARENLTLAPAIDFTGVRRLSSGALVGLVPPLSLHDIYVVGTLGTTAVHASGSIGISNCTATVAGSRP